MRIDPRRFLELLVLLMICLWLTLICLNGFPKAYGGYAVSMLQWGAAMQGGDEYGRKGMERPESKTEAKIVRGHVRRGLRPLQGAWADAR